MNTAPDRVAENLQSTACASHSFSTTPAGPLAKTRETVRSSNGPGQAGQEDHLAGTSTGNGNRRPPHPLLPLLGRSKPSSPYGTRQWQLQAALVPWRNKSPKLSHSIKSGLEGLCCEGMAILLSTEWWGCSYGRCFGLLTFTSLLKDSRSSLTLKRYGSKVLFMHASIHETFMRSRNLTFTSKSRSQIIGMTTVQLHST